MMLSRVKFSLVNCDMATHALRRLNPPVGINLRLGFKLSLYRNITNTAHMMVVV
jgi:hypothetical protein